MSGNRHKLREFEWFEMETRVRQMVQELITPFTKRIFQTMSGINSLKSTSHQEATKLEELRKIVTNDPEGKDITIFKQIDQKQEKLRFDLYELQNMVSQSEKVIEKRIRIQDDRLQESKQIVLNNMKLKERVSEEIFFQNNTIKQLRDELQSIISEIRLSLDKTIKDQQDDARLNKMITQKLCDRIHILEDNSKVVEQKFEKNTKQHSNINSKIIHFQQETVQIHKEIKSLQDNLIYVKKLGNYVKELEEKINKQDFALQHLSPLITQAQLSQTLYSILPQKQKRKLVVYEYEKFSALNNHILETDPKKSKQLFNGIGALENVQKRNTKEIIDMKRKKLISMGINIDNLNYEAKQKFYKEVSLQDDEIDDESQVRGVSNGPDSSQIANTINKMIELASADFNMKISHQIADSKRYFEQIEDQLQNNLEKSVTLIDGYNSAFQKFKVEQDLVNMSLEEKINNMIDDKESNKKSTESLSQSLMSIMQFCTLINHLQIQDELDKQSISLFGLKQQFLEQQRSAIENVSETKKKSVVNLQKQCFSCNGYPASTLSAFKMACLAYTPSSIVLDNKEYKRQELLEISTRILQHLKVDLQHPKHSNTTISDNTIKKRAYTQPAMIESVISMSPPKPIINKLPKFNSTMSQIRSKTRSKILKAEPHRKVSNAALLSSVFNETKKRHSIYVQKKYEYNFN